ncbi:MAG: 50S ribosomal protein L31 [Anaerotruncus massiliensis (ex Togo et al. 2019)]
MKEGIHPKYVDTTITCACGGDPYASTRRTSALKSAQVPSFTGRQELVDTDGR